MSLFIWTCTIVCFPSTHGVVTELFRVIESLPAEIRRNSRHNPVVHPGSGQFVMYWYSKLYGFFILTYMLGSSKSSSDDGRMKQALGVFLLSAAKSNYSEEELM